MLTKIANEDGSSNPGFIGKDGMFRGDRSRKSATPNRKRRAYVAPTWYREP